MPRNSHLNVLLAVVGLLPAAGASAASPATAATPPDALKSNACLACHGLTSKIVGPAFSDVSAKYQGQANAAAKLREGIKKGGSGKWGPVPMPPQPALSDKDLTAIVDWLMAGAKK